MFYVGQEVVCVEDDQEQASRLCKVKMGDNGLKKGEIYTVLQTGITHPYDWLQLPCIRVSGPYPEAPVWASRFRPLTKTKTEVLNTAEA